MPSPVKNGLPVPLPQAKPAAVDDARGEVFRDELSRRQTTGAGGSTEGALARRPETKPPGKRQPIRPGRPHRAGGEGRSPEVRANPDAHSGAKPDNTSVGVGPDGVKDGDAVAPSGQDATAGDPTAEAASPDASATSMAVAPLVAVPPAGDVPADGDEGASAEDHPSAPPAVIMMASGLAVPGATNAADEVESLDGSGSGGAAQSDAPVGHAPRRASVSPLFGEASGDVQSGSTGEGEAKAQSAAVARASDTETGAADMVDGPWSDGTRSPGAAPVAHTAVSSSEDITTAQATVVPTVEGRATTHAAPAVPQQPAALPPEARFAAANHENIVTSMRAEVLPNGGTMRLRLDPPQLGTMNVTVQIQDGLITAAFETSSDEATRLLGHSLNQLKSVLESSGVGVDRLQVTQAPREAQPSNTQSDARHNQGGSPSQDQEQSARQEQQRREMLRRMWRRLTGEPDPLDLTA